MSTPLVTPSSSTSSQPSSSQPSSSQPSSSLSAASVPKCLSISQKNLIELKKNFVENGFAKIDNFCTPDVIQKLKTKIYQLIQEFDLSTHPISIFTTDQGNEGDRGTDEYFMSSADKIHYFLEQDAYDSIEKKLKVSKDQCLNKVGHALHILLPEFSKLTFSDAVKDIAKSIGLVDPVVVQSMIIFKNAHVGGSVLPHQDASYLHCLPSSVDAVVGFWIPLDDATLENGCLQFAVGSHKRHMTPATRWTRVVDPETKRVRMEHTEPNAKYNDESLVPIPANSGDCLLIDGLIVHASEPNNSDNARWVYTFHCYDRSKGDWDPGNWLQPTQQGNFASLYN